MQRSCWLGLVLLLGVCACWAADSSSLRVDEDHVRIRLLPTPLLELPVVNNSGKPLQGTFRLELLDRKANSVAWTTGAFQEESGATVEKLPWDADKLPSNQPSGSPGTGYAMSLFQMRLQESPRPGA